MPRGSFSPESDRLLQTLQLVNTLDSMDSRNEANRRADEANQRAQAEAALQQSQAATSKWHQDEGVKRSAELNRFATEFDPTDPEARTQLATWRAYTAGHLSDGEFADTLGPKLKQLDALDNLAFSNKDLGYGWTTTTSTDPATGRTVTRIDVPGSIAKWNADRARVDEQEKALPTDLRVIAGDLQNTQKWDKRTATEAVYQTKVADDAITEARNLGVFHKMAAEENAADKNAHSTPVSIERRIRGEASWGPGQADPMSLGLPAGSPTSLNPNPTTPGGKFLLSYDKVNSLLGDKLAQARNDKAQGAVNAGVADEVAKQANETIKNQTELLRSLNVIDQNTGLPVGAKNPEQITKAIASITSALDTLSAANAGKLQHAANAGAYPVNTAAPETAVSEAARKSGEHMNDSRIPAATHSVSLALAPQGSKVGDDVLVTLPDGTRVTAKVTK
jgi:hypothetical protein